RVEVVVGQPEHDPHPGLGEQPRHGVPGTPDVVHGQRSHVDLPFSVVGWRGSAGRLRRRRRPALRAWHGGRRSRAGLRAWHGGGRRRGWGGGGGGGGRGGGGRGWGGGGGGGGA